MCSSMFWSSVNLENKYLIKSYSSNFKLIISLDLPTATVVLVINPKCSRVGKLVSFMHAPNHNL